MSNTFPTTICNCFLQLNCDKSYNTICRYRWTLRYYFYISTYHFELPRLLLADKIKLLSTIDFSFDNTFHAKRLVTYSKAHYG